MEANTRHAATLALALALIMPLSLAASITQPQGDLQAHQLPLQTTLAWTGTAPFQIQLQGPTTLQNTTNQTSTQVSLQQGQYTLTVTDQNTTATRNFSVTQTPLTIGITANKQTYEVSEIVQLTATSNRPTQTTLRLLRNQEQVEQYSVSLDGTIQLYYIPEQPGTYEARLTAQNTTANTAFTVQQVQPLSAQITHTAPRQGQPTNFTAVVTGGQAPYTYSWIFSDGTAGQGREHTHYFFDQGTYTATLVVTDATNTQTSATRTFEVQAPRYEVEITVRDQHGRMLRDMTVDVKGPEEHSTRTSSTGLVLYSLPRGNYTLTIRQFDYVYRQDNITVNQDLNLLYTISIEYDEEPVQQEQPQQEEEQTANAELEALQTRAQELQRAKEDNLTKLSQRRFDLKLDPKKDRVLEHLGLYTRFDEATQNIQRATTQEEITPALSEVPLSVTIINEQSTISYPDPEEQEDLLAEFLAARGVNDAKLQRTYKHSVAEEAKSTTIKTTVTEALIQYPGKEERHKIITREISANPETYAIEAITTDFATDVSKLKIRGRHQVLKSDLVLRFDEHQYVYSAQTTAPTPQLPLIVPLELKSPTGLSGLLSVRLGDSDPTRSLAYVIILGIFIGGLVVGRKVASSRTDKERLDAFSDLAGHAITMMQSGNSEQAAQTLPEIKALYDELPIAQQQALSEVMQALNSTATQAGFETAINEAYRTVSQAQGDINSITSAYEKAIAAFEQLPAEEQETHSARLKELETHLDRTLTA
jgi:PKD repeat protein